MTQLTVIAKIKAKAGAEDYVYQELRNLFQLIPATDSSL